MRTGIGRKKELEFVSWYVHKEDKSGSVGHVYSLAIKSISRHYSEQIKKEIDLFEIDDIEFIKELSKKYGKDGQYKEIGNKGKGNYRFALSAYYRFLTYKNKLTINYNENNNSTNNIMEIDIIYFLSLQLKAFYPDYKEIKRAKMINTNTTDLLFENIKKDSFLIVRIVEGIANIEAFNDIKYYYNVLSEEHYGVNIQCVIIGNEIDESLMNISNLNNNFQIMKYKINIKLEKVS